MIKLYILKPHAKLYGENKGQKGICGMRIAICDDERLDRELIVSSLNDIEKERKYKFDIEIYDGGKQLLDALKGAEWDALFLDIDMPEKDGLQLSQELKAKNPKCMIIMATGMVERYKEAFYIKAHRFVTKPFDKEEVEEALFTAIEEENNRNFIEVYYQRNQYNILQEEIQYLEAYSGYTELEIAGKRFRKDNSLLEIENILSDILFVRVDRKYIVNLRYVQTYSNDKFIIGDKRFSISRRNRKKFEHKYVEFDLKHRRNYT